MLPELYSEGENLSDEEVYRAKNKLYNELCNLESATDNLQQVGPQMLYLNRRVSKAEIASRVASIDTQHLRDVCKRYFRNPSITLWGPR